MRAVLWISLLLLLAVGLGEEVEKVETVNEEGEDWGFRLYYYPILLVKETVTDPLANQVEALCQSAYAPFEVMMVTLVRIVRFREEPRKHFDASHFRHAPDFSGLVDPEECRQYPVSTLPHLGDI